MDLRGFSRPHESFREFHGITGVPEVLEALHCSRGVSWGYLKVFFSISSELNLILHMYL